ncbi:MAG: hypothetical protein JW927_01425 [Deltaproteobacteria bacterium]|nr:hypothetical protein [Deltaproteobacteria bacterium]
MIIAHNKKPESMYYVEKILARYKENKNPLDAWETFLTAIRFKTTVPGAIVEYLADVAKEIVKIAQNPPKPKDRPVALAKALKLNKDDRGQGSPFTEYQTNCADRLLALDVIQNEYYSPDAEDYAFEDVAKICGKSKSTVRRIVKKQQKRWHAIAKQLIESDAVEYGLDGLPRIGVAGTADDMSEAIEILKEIKRIKASE